MSKRIGLSMRVVQDVATSEWRDCLAQDWSRFMTRVLPEIAWVMVPNDPDGVMPFVRKWELDGFILTGGNDVGSCSCRDATETELIRHAVETRSPLLGVCRGMQMIQHYWGGELRKTDSAVHIARTHAIQLAEMPGIPDSSGGFMVNSFHGQGVKMVELAPALRSFALFQDEWVEGLHLPDYPLMGIQWHPERDHPSTDLDLRLIRHLFLSEGQP